MHSKGPAAATADSLVDTTPSSASSREQRRKWARVKLLLLFLVGASPVIASYFTYYVVRPEGRRNYGNLISPPRPLPAIAVTDVHRTDAGGSASADAPLALPSLKGQWLLLSVAGGACGTVCERHLYLQRQLREALGKDKDRVDWLWLVRDHAPIAPALMPALAQATVLRLVQANDPALAAWLALPDAGATAATAADADLAAQELDKTLYLVDPQGNLMMRFPENLDPKKALADLNRLLRAANSWDRAGRGF